MTTQSKPVTPLDALRLMRALWEEPLPGWIQLAPASKEKLRAALDAADAALAQGEADAVLGYCRQYSHYGDGAQPAACPDCRGVCMSWPSTQDGRFHECHKPHTLNSHNHPDRHPSRLLCVEWRVTEPCPRHGAGGEGV